MTQPIGNSVQQNPVCGIVRDANRRAVNFSINQKRALTLILGEENQPVKFHRRLTAPQAVYRKFTTVRACTRSNSKASVVGLAEFPQAMAPQT